MELDQYLILEKQVYGETAFYEVASGIEIFWNLLFIFLILIFTYHSDSALLLEFYFNSCIFPEIYLTILYSQTPNTFCRHYCLVHRFQNNYTIYLPANPIEKVEKPHPTRLV